MLTANVVARPRNHEQHDRTLGAGRGPPGAARTRRDLPGGCPWRVTRVVLSDPVGARNPAARRVRSSSGGEPLLLALVVGAARIDRTRGPGTQHDRAAR